ncbi:hypothetical protein LTR84_010988 [Exophiala bonariae]|uniref:Uncharacterized protein n=1 Tax=Exophiala bonariae TaxID=1690606 RepID=A0AAV9NM96_9EURO|nr:hypothetical protein LTR84_010988 [Exophiala bonariae]
MAARYIPPHARNGHQTANSINSTAKCVSPHLQDGELNPSLGDLGRDHYRTVKEIKQYFWPNGNADLKVQDSSCEDLKDEDVERDHSCGEKVSNTSFGTEDNDGKPIKNNDPPLKSHATLLASAAHPRVLSYVLVFHDSNPRWKKDNIIFAKSNLHLLPPEHSDDLKIDSNNDAHGKNSDMGASCGVPREEVPIAVFHGARSCDRNRMDFDAWYRVSRVQILEPHTAELERMMGQKFSLLHMKHSQDAKTKKFERSLKRKWAVIKLEKDVQANLKRGKPIIPRLEGKEGRGSGKTSSGSAQTLGVNEMLRILRLRDDEGKAGTHEDVQEGAQDSEEGHEAAQAGFQNDAQEGAQGSPDAKGDIKESHLNSAPNDHDSPNDNEQSPKDDNQKDTPEETPDAAQKAPPVKGKKKPEHKNTTTDRETHPAKRSIKLDPTVPSFVPKMRRDNA